MNTKIIPRQTEGLGYPVGLRTINPTDEKIKTKGLNADFRVNTSSPHFVSSTVIKNRIKEQLSVLCLDITPKASLVFNNFNSFMYNIE